MSAEISGTPISKYLVFVVICILLFIIVRSALMETLIPFYRNGEYEEFAYNLVGIIILLIGTGIFGYGGWLILINTSVLIKDERIFNNIEIIRNKTLVKEDRKRARIENTKMLFSAWRKGAIKLLIGGLIILCGGIIINLKKIIG